MNLLSNISSLKLTKKQLELFNALNFNTINDVINYYPSSYQDFNLTNLDEGRVVVEAKIVSNIKIAYFQGRKNRIYFDVNYQNRAVKVVIFNRSFLFNSLKQSENITIIGYYTKKNNTIVANEIKLKPLMQIEKIIPNYSLVNKYKNNDYLKLIKNIFTNLNNISNLLPDELINKYDLLNRYDCLRKIHFPTTMNDVMQAQRTLIYEEFFIFAINTLIDKQNKHFDVALKKQIPLDKIEQLIQKLSYHLTSDQRNALNDIFKDFISPTSMNRLLLADVGSGKTLVALISAYMIYLANYQTAFMAPTTILAQQHYEEANKIFKETKIKIALLTSQTSNIQRDSIIKQLKNNEIDLLIGTHSLYQDDIIYHKLGLVIIDEQQRFGVLQRNKLKEKGNFVEQLMLSATPIPRTLAQVAFADIQTSYMKESLPFKKPIISYYFKSKSIKPFYDKMIELLELKQQIYIVTPLVEESETIDTKNVIEIHNNISHHFKDRYQVGLIHGRMSNDLKIQTMEDFANHNIDILVATSLIEVGISVNNATCIIIYDAHRFGLSQLHQLRGRVGRDDKQGYCVFLSNSNDENIIKKLQYLKDHQDGFLIAEYDLTQRGPGDILGTKQSGLPTFNIANPMVDHKIYEIAYQDANDLFKNAKLFAKFYDKNRDYLKKITIN